MANGVGTLLELQGKVNVDGAVVLIVGSTLAPSGDGSSGGVNVFPALQGKTTADNELVVRFV